MPNKCTYQLFLLRPRLFEPLALISSCDFHQNNSCAVSHTKESYLNLHFRRLLPLKGYQGAGRKSGTEQSRSTKAPLEAHKKRENPFRAGALTAEDGLQTRRKITNICRAGLVTRMGSSFLSSMLVRLTFKCILLTKLF